MLKYRSLLFVLLFLLITGVIYYWPKGSSNYYPINALKPIIVLQVSEEDLNLGERFETDKYIHYLTI